MQTGNMRYNWMHSIANQNLMHDRRISITFRETKVDKGKKIKQ